MTIPESWDELADAVLTHDAERQHKCWDALCCKAPLQPERADGDLQRHVWHPRRRYAAASLVRVLLDWLARRVPDVRPVVFDRPTPAGDPVAGPSC